jgi:hypothetical protein
MIRALGQLFFGNSFAGQHLGLSQLLLLLLMRSLELQKRHQNIQISSPVEKHLPSLHNPNV